MAVATLRISAASVVTATSAWELQENKQEIKEDSCWNYVEMEVAVVTWQCARLTALLG